MGLTPSTPPPSENEPTEVAADVDTQDVAMPMSAQDAEVVKRAMAMLIKHRGGGPFGMGRLEIDEIPQLETNLLNAVATLGQLDFGEGPAPTSSPAVPTSSNQVDERTPKEKIQDDEALTIGLRGGQATASYMEQLQAARAKRNTST